MPTVVFSSQAVENAARDIAGLLRAVANERPADARLVHRARGDDVVGHGPACDIVALDQFKEALRKQARACILD